MDACLPHLPGDELSRLVLIEGLVLRLDLLLDGLLLGVDLLVSSQRVQLREHLAALGTWMRL